MIFNSTTDTLGTDEFGATTLQAPMRETVYSFNPILWAFRESQQFRGPLSVAQMAANWLATEKERPWTDWGSPEAIEHAKKVLTRISTSIRNHPTEEAERG